MNTIKFRVWDNKNNCFVEKNGDKHNASSGLFVIDLNGELRFAEFPQGNGDNAADSVFNDKFNIDNRYIIQQYVIQQYIGIRDVNGKEIYEGDIVTYDDSEVSENPIIGTAEVIFCNDLCVYPVPCYALFFLKDGSGIHNSMFGRIEVIGNIFENPELVS